MSGTHDNWFHERESAWLYGRVAAAEPDPRKRELFLSLAAAAERQAQRWERSAKEPPPPFRPTLRARLVAWLVRRFGPRPMRTPLAAMKLRGLSVYDAPFVPGHAMPTSVEQVGQRHRGLSSGNNLRAAVFGVNDGLVSNASLIMGVAGAGVSHEIVVTTGIAGLLAGALSMAAGEYVSVRAQREMYEYQIALEREELAEYPEEEAEELALIYAARGLELEQARDLARRTIAQPEHALQALSREELGIDPDSLGSPWSAAAWSFVSFAFGALVPLAPFAFASADGYRLEAAAGASALGLFVIGMTISLFTGRNALMGGLRMLLIGGGAALATHLIGRLLGVAFAA